MKRMQLGLFFLFLTFFVIRPTSCKHSCAIDLVDPAHQNTKLNALAPIPIPINKVLWHDVLESLDLQALFVHVPCVLSSTDLQQFIFYCAATKRYQQVIFTLEHDQIQISLMPHLILGRCEISGHPYDAQGIIHDYFIKPGMPFDMRFHRYAVTQLENSYKQKGYLDVQVNHRLQEDMAQKSISVELEIQSGVAQEATRNAVPQKDFAVIVTFEGNKRVSSEKLRSVLALYGDALAQLPPSMVASTIADWYHAHGYSDAQVGAQAVQDGLYIMIEEGQYAHSQIVTQPTRQMQQEPHQFGATLLQKTSQLPDKYITREIQYMPGQSYNEQAIADTLRRLNKLQIFDRVHLHPSATPFDATHYTMELQVRDDLPRELRTRAGLSLQQMSKEFSFKNVSYAAGGTFLLKNPTNHADLFFIDADYTYGEQILSAQYQYPWIAGLPIDARFQVYAMQYLQPGLRHNHKNIYSFIQQGMLMGLQYQKGDWDAQINYGLEWMETKLRKCHEYPLYCQELSRALNFTPLLLDKKIPYLFTEPSIMLDRLDDQLNPSRGTLTLFTAKAMMPSRYLSLNSSFLKILFDHAYFVPFNYAILATRMRVGHIFFNHFENIMPAERFYMGGANSIRSYETDLCPPLGVLVDEYDNARFVPQGALSMVNLNVELRIPVKRNLWFALFQDMGALSNTKFADIKMRHILAGTGAGIRIQTPIGPLRFDFAFKWHRPDPAIAPYCWFLSFGNAF